MSTDRLRVLRIPALAALCGLMLAIPPSPARAAEPARTEFLNSGKVLSGDLPFSEAVRHGDTLYLSGQVGIAPGTMQLVPGGIRSEAQQALANIRAVLEAHGRTTRDILKCTVMLADMADWPAFNEVWRAFLEKPYPARSAFGASGLALGARVEVECTASAAH
jgi:reactive intermediate/imine deaminase